MKEDAHGGQCQFDFDDGGKTILTCRLNPGHRIVLYNDWRASTMKEMLDKDILVGAAKEEAQILSFAKEQAALLQKTKPAE